MSPSSSFPGHKQSLSGCRSPQGSSHWEQGTDRAFRVIFAPQQANFPRNTPEVVCSLQGILLVPRIPQHFFFPSFRHFFCLSLQAFVTGDLVPQLSSALTVGEEMAAVEIFPEWKLIVTC